MRQLSALLRSWERATLNGSLLPQLVALPDAAKAVALTTLLTSRGAPHNVMLLNASGADHG